MTTPRENTRVTRTLWSMSLDLFLVPVVLLTYIISIFINYLVKGIGIVLFIFSTSRFVQLNPVCH